MKKVNLAFVVCLISFGIGMTKANASTKYVTNSPVTVHKMKDGKQTHQFTLPKYAVINKSFSTKRKGYTISSLYYPNKHYVFKSSGNTQYVVYSDNFYRKYSSVKKHTTRVQLSHYPDNKLYTYEYTGATVFIKVGGKLIKTASSDNNATITLPKKTKNKKISVCMYNGKSQNFKFTNTIAKGVFTTTPNTLSVSYTNNTLGRPFQSYRSFTVINGSLNKMIEKKDNSGVTFNLSPSVAIAEKAMKNHKKYVSATLTGSNGSSTKVKLMTNELALK